MTFQGKHSRMYPLVVATILVLHVGLGFTSALQQPDAMISYSILIFALSQKEIDAALYGLVEPLMP